MNAMFTPRQLLEAARVPDTVPSGKFGPWQIRRQEENEVLRAAGIKPVGWQSYTLLLREVPMTEANMHLHPHDDGEPARECVMEESQTELRRHLPIWMAAHGRVLVTGLGLGCVVRGLLALPTVTHVDVVEIDGDILRAVGPEFHGHPRCTVYKGDALTMEIPGRWDFAWHDLWSADGDGELQRQHMELMARFRNRCGPQGAWALPRFVKRIWPWPEKLLK
jgi:hypothetical protein